MFFEQKSPEIAETPIFIVSYNKHTYKPQKHYNFHIWKRSCSLWFYPEFWGWGSAELIFRGFLFLKNLGANASMHFSPKISRWTLTCSPWVCRPSVGCVTCCLLEKAEREWGAPPEQGHSDTADFSAHFLRIFAWLWNTYFSSAKMSKKNLRKMGAKMGAKICAPKICAKIGAKICAPKMGAKMGAKICAPKICAKNRFEHSVCLEDGSQKKNTQKNICAKLAQNPSPKEFASLFAPPFWFCISLPLAYITTTETQQQQKHIKQKTHPKQQQQTIQAATTTKQHQLQNKATTKQQNNNNTNKTTTTVIAITTKL